MLRLAQLSVRRPLASLLAWGAIALALSAIGLGVTGALSPSIVVVAGSESARAEHLAQSQFGPSVLVPILLRGPQEQIDRQGPDSSACCPSAPTRACCRHGTRAPPARRCGRGPTPR